jgi:hypothetical protein
VIETPLPKRGYTNGAINWDARTRRGDLVESEEYNWFLDLRNCSYSEWWRYGKYIKKREAVGPFPGVFRWKTRWVTAFPVFVEY